MERINSIDFDTKNGLRTVEFYHGDILQYPEKVDLLIVSVYGNSYESVPGTLIGSLGETGMDLYDLIRNIELDLRNSLSTLLTSEIKGYFFKRIVFFEIKSLINSNSINQSLSDIFENLFISLLVLEKKGYVIRKIILPFIGTGKQKIPVEEVAVLLPAITEKLLTNLQHLEKVIFVDKDKSKATLLSDRIDKLLGRPNLFIAKDIFAENIRILILKKISVLESLSKSHSYFLEGAKKVFDNSNLKGYQIAITGRKLLEINLNIITKLNEGTLAEKISNLEQLKVPAWIKSYMHMIRIFGNEMAHVKVSEGQVLVEMTQEDVLLNLVCIERILDFTCDFVNKNADR